MVFFIKWKILVTILLILEYVLTIKKDLAARLEEANLSREKRYLLFPNNFYTLIIGVGVPVEVTPESLLFGWAFRALYTVPYNLSQLQLMEYGSSRKSRNSRSVSRWDIYRMMEAESEYRGFGGKPCVLRTICEASDKPFDKYFGLLEEFFHSIFTPTTTSEEIRHHTDNEYFAAQNLGRKYTGKCRQMFPGCKMSLMEMFTYTPSENDYLYM